MSQNNQSTFMARAALFASPVDTSAVPKKKIAREMPLPPAPVFLDDAPEQVNDVSRVAVEAPRAAGLVDDGYMQMDESVEAMEVDGTFLPSPQRATPQRGRTPGKPLFVDTSAASPKRNDTEGSTPCEKATTPRRKSSRKSMPTPGKRLFFTSKDTENEERKADESTKIELLMAQSPDEIPKAVRDLVQDRKEMKTYDLQLKREIEDIQACKKTRETMLKQATDVVSTGHISSAVVVPLTPLDLSIRKEEAPTDTVKRLVGNFLVITEEGGELKKAKNQLAAITQENDKLKSQLSALEELQKENETVTAQQNLEATKLYDEIKQLEEEKDKVDDLIEMCRRPMSKFKLYL